LIPDNSQSSFAGFDSGVYAGVLSSSPTSQPNDNGVSGYLAMVLTYLTNILLSYRRYLLQSSTPPPH